MPVTLVEGSVDNVKLTLKRDIAMADEKLSRIRLPDVRTGNGYDVHQLVAGDGVTLCGVFIPHDQKLLGHSDADVALHALTDALLATCGAGDIGDHFPPSDPQWKGAASRIFLEHAAKIVRDNGGTIMNADISLIAEAPKVGPHRLAMRENLAVHARYFPRPLLGEGDDERKDRLRRQARGHCGHCDGNGGLCGRRKMSGWPEDIERQGGRVDRSIFASAA